MPPQKSDDSTVLDAAAAKADAARWADWLRFDLEHFVTPLTEATGLSAHDVLLYLISERVAQLVDFGITLHIEHKHGEGDDDELPGEEWKK